MLSVDTLIHMGLQTEEKTNMCSYLCFLKSHYAMEAKQLRDLVITFSHNTPTNYCYN